MSNSPLVTYTLLSPNRTHPRTKPIDTITIHCFVGQVTAKRGCEVFQPTKRQASCNYVVGYDGSIGLCVNEEDRSWCSGGSLTAGGMTGSQNDQRAITIEVACDSVYPYTVTNAAFEALIALVADICERNNIKELLWLNDKSLVGKTAEQNMTLHRWFANKACPGQYLYQRHEEIADRVNQTLKKEDDDMITQEQFDQMFEVSMARHRRSLQDNDCSIWSGAAREFCISEGIFSGSGRLPDGSVNFMWQDCLTREQAAQLIYNLAAKYGLVKQEPTEE